MAESSQSKKILLSYQNWKKILSLERNLTYTEFLDKSRDVLGLARSQPVFLQRFDEVWGECVDVDDMEQILNKDKLFLLDACAPPVTENLDGNILETGNEIAEITKTNKHGMKKVQKTLCFEEDHLVLGPTVEGKVLNKENLQSVSVDSEKIQKQSQIYKLKTDDKLFDYHQEINEASFTLAMENPLLLCDKTDLQKQARLKLHNDDCSYKNKVSRYKEFGNASSVASKREYIKPDVREKRVEQLQEDLKEVDLQLHYAVKQRERCANVNNFSKALDESKEIEDLRNKKRKYEEELTLLQKKSLSSKRVKKCTDKKKARLVTQKGDLRQFSCKSATPVSQPHQSTSSDEGQVTVTDQSTCSFREDAERQATSIDEITCPSIKDIERQATPTGLSKRQSIEDVESQATSTDESTCQSIEDDKRQATSTGQSTCQSSENVEDMSHGMDYCQQASPCDTAELEKQRGENGNF